MSITYNASTNFGAKDALPVNDPDKVIYGAEFTTEFNAITAAFGNAAPTASPTFTGTATFSDVDINGSTVTIGTESISDTLIGGWNTTKSTVDAGATNWDTAYGWGDHSAAGYADGTNEANWDTAYGDKIDSASFNTGDGVLTLTRQDTGTVTVDLDGRYSTTDTNTTYSAGTNMNLSGTTFNLDSSLTGLSDVTTSAVSIGSWEIKLDGSDLRFIYNGTDRIRFTTAGAIIAENNITAYGSA